MGREEKSQLHSGRLLCVASRNVPAVSFKRGNVEVLTTQRKLALHEDRLGYVMALTHRHRRYCKPLTVWSRRHQGLHKIGLRDKVCKQYIATTKVPDYQCL